MNSSPNRNAVRRFMWLEERKASATWAYDRYTVTANDPFVVGQGKTLSEAVAQAMAQEKRKAKKH